MTKAMAVIGMVLAVLVMAQVAWGQDWTAGYNAFSAQVEVTTAQYHSAPTSLKVSSVDFGGASKSYSVEAGSSHIMKVYCFVPTGALHGGYVTVGEQNAPTSGYNTWELLEITASGYNTITGGIAPGLLGINLCSFGSTIYYDDMMLTQVRSFAENKLFYGNINNNPNSTADEKREAMRFFADVAEYMDKDYLAVVNIINAYQDKTWKDFYRIAKAKEQLKDWAGAKADLESAAALIDSNEVDNVKLIAQEREKVKLLIE